MAGDAVHVTALVTEDNLKRAADKLFSPPRDTAGLSRDHMIHTYRRTGGALRLRFQSLLELIRETRSVAGAFLIGLFFAPKPLTFVVLSAALCVRENVVSGHDLFQFLGGFPIIWISIRMVLKHQFSIGAFYFVCSCFALYAQEGIIID